MRRFGKQQSVVHSLMMLILLCYPILLLTIKEGMGGAFFLMLIAAWVCLRSSCKVADVNYWDDVGVKFAIAMTLPTVAILLSQIAHGEVIARYYDGPLRFLLAILVFQALRITNIRVIAILQYGFPLGAIAAAYIVLFGQSYQRSYDYYSGTQRVSSYFLDLIHFGDFALLLGLLSIIAINWSRPDPPHVLLLKISGFLAGLFVSIQSGSRGGWLAIPVVLLAWYILKRQKKFSFFRFGLSLVALMFIVLVGYFTNHMIHLRADELYEHLYMSAHGELDSTIGIRFQHWKAALYMFMENPIFGVGLDGFPRAINELYKLGVVSQKAAFEGQGEAHSDILASVARMGVFGLLSSLALYFMPLALFLKLARSPQGERNVAAVMGVCFVTGFFVFGLTVEIFSLKMASAFYGFTLAALLAGAVLEDSMENKAISENKG